MPEDVSIDDERRIILIESHGKVTSDDFRASLASVLRLRRERGFDRVLVEATRVTGYPSTIPVYEFGAEAAAQLRGLRMASVTGPETRDEAVFFETVSRNRRFDVRVFASTASALAWLRESSQNDQASSP